MCLRVRGHACVCVWGACSLPLSLSSGQMEEGATLTSLPLLLSLLPLPLPPYDTAWRLAATPATRASAPPPHPTPPHPTPRQSSPPPPSLPSRPPAPHPLPKLQPLAAYLLSPPVRRGGSTLACLVLWLIRTEEDK